MCILCLRFLHRQTWLLIQWTRDLQQDSVRIYLGTLAINFSFYCRHYHWQQKQVLTKVTWDEHVATTTSQNALFHCSLYNSQQTATESYWTLRECYEALWVVTERCRSVMRYFLEHYRTLWSVAWHYGTLRNVAGALTERYWKYRLCPLLNEFSS